MEEITFLWFLMKLFNSVSIMLLESIGSILDYYLYYLINYIFKWLQVVHWKVPLAMMDLVKQINHLNSRLFYVTQIDCILEIHFDGLLSFFLLNRLYCLVITSNSFKLLKFFKLIWKDMAENSENIHVYGALFYRFFKFFSYTSLVVMVNFSNQTVKFLI